eukprot:PhM_4_TR14107/c1_g2_i1/m.95395
MNISSMIPGLTTRQASLPIHVVASWLLSPSCPVEVSVFGGYLRDSIACIVPNDVDIRIPFGTDPSAVFSEMQRCLNVTVQETSFTRPRAARHFIVRSSQDCDNFNDGVVVDVSWHGMASPYPTCDVNNLRLSRTNGLELIASTPHGIDGVIEHIHRRQFTVYDVSTSVKPFQRLVSRGWTCLSHPQR